MRYFSISFLFLLVCLGLPTPAVAQDQSDDRVVFIGTSGIQWDEINQSDTPNIWSTARSGGVGALIVRTAQRAACPADGWLAISAGNRVRDRFNATYRPCRELENVHPQFEEVTPFWQEYVDFAKTQNYDAKLGTLGGIVKEQNISATAIGPGAAIALSTLEGQVAGQTIAPATTWEGQYTADSVEQIETALTQHELAVIDVGSLRDPGYETEYKKPKSPDQVVNEDEQAESEIPGPEESLQTDKQRDLRELDNRLGTILELLRKNDPEFKHTTVIFAALADSSTTPRYQVVTAFGNNTQLTFKGMLSSPSTRQPMYVQTTDLTPTILALLNKSDAAPDGVLVGSPMTSDGGQINTQKRIDALVDQEKHTLETRPLIAPFYTVFTVVNLFLFLSVLMALSRWGFPAFTRSPHQFITSTRNVALAVAALPVATFLANVVPWWRTASPTFTLTVVIFTIITLILLITLVPRWRSTLLAPMTTVSTITAFVIAIDIATGGQLQISSLMGVQPTVAGRFYGFNNTAFALFLTTSVLFAAVSVNSLVAQGRRKLAAGVVATIGAIAVFLDGMPSIGADFGGPPALVPAFALLCLQAAGVKITWKKILLVLVSAVLAVTAFAAIDYLRPAQDRTHLGRFVETVLDGGFFTVVGRKLSANLSTFTNPLSLVAIAGVLVVIVGMGRPIRDARKNLQGESAHWLTEGTPMSQITARAPMFTPGVMAAVVGLIIGTLVNDSGVVILGVGISILSPLAIATYAHLILAIREKPILNEKTVS